MRRFNALFLCYNFPVSSGARFALRPCLVKPIVGGIDNMYQFTPYNMPYLGVQNVPQQTFAQKQEIIRVSGENGAKALNLAPNSSALLLDETQPVVWLKTTDGAGYPTVTGYSISPLQTKEEKDESRFDLIEKRLNDLEVAINDKSNARNVESEQTVKYDATVITD